MYHYHPGISMPVSLGDSDDVLFALSPLSLHHSLTHLLRLLSNAPSLLGRHHYARIAG